MNNKDETKNLINSLLHENKKYVRESLNKKHSGGDYYPRSFTKKLSSNLILKYKASARDIIRKIYLLKNEEEITTIFLGDEVVTEVEKKVIPKATLEQDIDDFINALNCLSDREKRLAFERTCLNAPIIDIMQKYGASEKEIKQAQMKFLCFYAYQCGEVI